MFIMFKRAAVFFILTALLTLAACSETGNPGSDKNNETNTNNQMQKQGKADQTVSKSATLKLSAKSLQKGDKSDAVNALQQALKKSAIRSRFPARTMRIRRGQ
ncbi:hypothetical protein P5G51_017990 [Virgibacillus sp. 179-BFC.A HS]|uniref:Lipoprotein n=1 Tax=Tigheibacillus jepli TaxID=3035914 RepID=A0ABU5CMG4_9BACI|nr:hypothetical protein [Virgibacillus sp. 179-BFC.A HS]MDY0406979.1 hypothetical protein [Virgibacillus sp. 179-BFC.A HS]